jgi:hypothetical protein
MGTATAAVAALALALASLAALVAGELTAGVGLFAAAIPPTAVAALGARVAMTVDEGGLTVQNLVRRHRIAWTELQAVDLGRGVQGVPRLALLRLRRHHDRTVDVGAIGCLGRRRRVAWVEAIAPVVLRHGVPITGTAVDPWHGLRAPDPAVIGAGPPPPSTETLWQVRSLRPPTRRDWLALGGVAALGAVALAVAVPILARDLALRDEGIRVVALVVGEPDPGGPRSDTHAAIRFRTRSGRDVRTEVVTTRHRVGDTIAVRYDPDDPERVRAVAGPALPWRFPLIVGLIALGVAALGALALLANRRAAREASTSS